MDQRDTRPRNTRPPRDRGLVLPEAHHMAGDAIQRVLAALERTGSRWKPQSGGYVAQCPAHEDGTPSMTVRNGDGKVLLYCHAGCGTEQILTALNLDWPSLFDAPTDPSPTRREIAATYDYTDAERVLRFQKVREFPKNFKNRRPDGRGGWIWNLEGVKRVLYHLPDVLEAISAGRTVWVCEGEKDADRVASLGHTTTCNYEGAAKEGQTSKWRPEYSETLRGAHVVVIADNDSAGYAHARAIGASLVGIAASIKLLRPILDYPKSDVSDQLAAGLGLDDLAPLLPNDVPPAYATETPPDESPDDDVVGDPIERIHQYDVSQELRKLRARDEAKRIFAAEQETPPEPETTRLVLGGAFIHDAPIQVPSIWGRGEEVFWSEGEPLLITGPTGVGKTTLGGQVIAGRLGLIPTVLGYPVTPGKRVLYLAMDRPVQIARALGRNLRQFPREVLDERIVFWRGPPPSDLAMHPSVLLELARRAGADTVVLDSLKDAAVKLSDEEVGQGLNRAMQLCVANDVQVMGYHHQTKRGAGGDSKPNSLADVYGSAWITAGVGSVLLLWGNAGDPVVELSHLKQPAGEIGPLQLTHDTAAGTMAIVVGEDVLDLLRSGALTAVEVATALYGATTPTKAQTEKARRKLLKLVDKELAVRISSPSMGGEVAGRKGGGDGARYGLAYRPRSPQDRSTSLHENTSQDASPQAERVTHPSTPDRSTESLHAPATPLHEPDVSAGRSLHAPLHDTSEPRSPTPHNPPFRGGVGKRGDHDAGAAADDLDPHGVGWLRAQLTTTPQTIARLATIVDATTTTIETALALLEAAGHAQCHTRPGLPDVWSLPRKEDTT